MNNNDNSVGTVSESSQQPSNESKDDYFERQARTRRESEEANRRSDDIKNLRAANEASERVQKMKRGIPLDETDTLSGPPRKLIGRTMAEVQARAIDWLWTGWIPKKYITLIVGETGAGKSTVLADIVARVTTGAPWPGETDVRAPGRVLWLGSEDGAEDMTVPRLLACNARREGIIEIQGVTQGGRRTTFSMQDDLEAVRQCLEYAQKENDPFTMLVVDPITSYLPGRRLRKVDMNDTGQFRSIIEPWFEIAQTNNLAICSVTHFNKDTTRSMLHRVMGSAAFTQTCRSLCAFVDQKSDEQPFGKAMLQVKTNLPEHPGGAWRFQTVKTTVGTDPANGKSIVATCPNWNALDPDLTPESLMGGERGPVSEYGAEFGPWLRTHFMTTAQGSALPVTGVRAAAIAANVASNDWWAKHSSRFVHKYNAGGTWMCVPK